MDFIRRLGRLSGLRFFEALRELFSFSDGEFPSGEINSGGEKGM
jgi:hypothetical protein